MSLSRALTCGASIAVCVAVALMVTPLNAQVTPYAYQPTGDQSYQPTGYQTYQPNVYQGYQTPQTAYANPVYPTASGNYQAPHVARMSPDQVPPPYPVVSTPTPSQATTPMQLPSNSTGQTAVSGNSMGCATGGCGSGGCCNLGGGFGTLFDLSGGCGYSGRSIGGHQGGCGRGCGIGSGYAGCGCSSFGVRHCRRWFGGIYGLYMDHDSENEVWLSWNGADLASALLGSRDGNPGWQPGNEVRFGSTFVHGGLAWEFVFWGLYGANGSRTIYASDLTGPGAALNSSLDFGGLEYDNGSGYAPVNDFYDDAQQHRAAKYFEVQNFEINLLRFPLATCVGPCGVTAGCGGVGAYNFGGMYGAAAPCGCGPRFSLVGTAGVRYMRTYEWFDFDTDDVDITFGNGPDELFYDTEVKNHLVGFQLGCAANWQATRRFSLYGDGKFGIYNNHIQMTSLIWGSGGFARVVAGLPYAGQNFDVTASKDDVAFLGELRLGGAYALRYNNCGAPIWRLYGGYRAVAITGVALPTNQIPAQFADVVGVSNIKSNGSLILHGLQAGVEIAY